MTTGERLRTLREKLGWTEARAAHQFGRSLASWQAMEGNRSAVNPSIIKFLEYQAQHMTDKKAVALTPAHLKLFRQKFELTQSTAAALVGVTRVTWNRWENNKEPIPSWLLDRLKKTISILKGDEK